MAKHVYYSGNVQGVGFRATAAWIARRHTVSGWVRNLVDGRVELLVDGPDLENFLADVRERMAENISDEEVHDSDADHSLFSFEIVD